MCLHAWSHFVLLKSPFEMRSLFTWKSELCVQITTMGLVTDGAHTSIEQTTHHNSCHYSRLDWNGITTVDNITYPQLELNNRIFQLVFFPQNKYKEKYTNHMKGHYEGSGMDKKTMHAMKVRKLASNVRPSSLFIETSTCHTPGIQMLWVFFKLRD